MDHAVFTAVEVLDTNIHAKGIPLARTSNKTVMGKMAENVNHCVPGSVLYKPTKHRKLHRLTLLISNQSNTLLVITKPLRKFTRYKPLHCVC